MLGRAGLSGVDNSNGVVRIGATTPGRPSQQDAPEPLVTAAKHVADHEIRAVGTIGGNLCATAGQAVRAAICSAAARVEARSPRWGAGGEQSEDVDAFLESGSGGLVLRSTRPAGRRRATRGPRSPQTHHYTMLAVTAVRVSDGVRVAASGVGTGVRRLPGVESALAGGASAERPRATRPKAWIADRRARVGLVSRANAAAARSARARTARLEGGR